MDSVDDMDIVDSADTVSAFPGGRVHVVNLLQAAKPGLPGPPALL